MVFLFVTFAAGGVAWAIVAFVLVEASWPLAAPLASVPGAMAVCGVIGVGQADLAEQGLLSPVEF